MNVSEKQSMKLLPMHFITLEVKTVLLERQYATVLKMTALQFNYIHLTQQSKTTKFCFIAQHLFRNNNSSCDQI